MSQDPQATFFAWVLLVFFRHQPHESRPFRAHFGPNTEYATDIGRTPAILQTFKLPHQKLREERRLCGLVSFRIQ